MQEVDINQTHGLQLGAEEDAYYIPNLEYTNLLASQQKLIKRLEKLQFQKKGFEERYFTLKRSIAWEGEEYDTLHLNPLETPAYQAAASQLISKINEMTRKVLGTTNKNLIISFKE